MLYNLFTNILNGLRAFADDAVNYLKCRSMCCNKINIYNPKSCFQGDIQNRWTRASTPGAGSPVRRDTSSKFFTPRNNISR